MNSSTTRMTRKTMSTTNHELQLANDFVQHTGCNIFLTGKAGTGKTTFLHNLQKNTAKRMIITAPTGVAAINGGGVTLHSFFQLPFGGVQLLVIGDCISSLRWQSKMNSAFCSNIMSRFIFSHSERLMV